MKIAIKTIRDKLIWNQAVESTLTEVRKWDGIIPDVADRVILSVEVSKKIAYKIKLT